MDLSSTDRSEKRREEARAQTAPAGSTRPKPSATSIKASGASLGVLMSTSMANIGKSAGAHGLRPSTSHGEELGRLGRDILGSSGPARGRPIRGAAEQANESAVIRAMLDRRKQAETLRVRKRAMAPGDPYLLF